MGSEHTHIHAQKTRPTPDSRIILDSSDLITYIRLHMPLAIFIPDAPTLFADLGWTPAHRGSLDVFHKHGLFEAVRHFLAGYPRWLLPVAMIVALPVVIMYVLALDELVCWVKERNLLLLWLFVVMVALPVVAGAVEPSPRLQIPALPLLVVMAGVAGARLAQRHRWHIGTNERRPG